MRRIIIWSSAALVLVLATVGLVVARADGPYHHGWCGRGWGFHGPMGYVSHELNLSGTQKSQIKTMWQTERPLVGSLVQEWASESKEMDSATRDGSLDDEKVKTIAARQGDTIAKLLVEKQRFMSKVYITVLNSEQRSKADELQKKWESGLDHVADRLGTQPAEK